MAGSAPTRSANQPLFFDSTDQWTPNVRDRTKKPGGVLHLHGDLSSHPLIHYWVADLSNVDATASFFLPMGFSHYSFTSYSSKSEWISAYPSAVIAGDYPVAPPAPPPSTPLPPPPTPFATPRQPPAVQPSVPPSNNNSVLIDADLLTKLLNTLNNHHNNQSRPSPPTAPSIPLWDGNPDNVCLFLEHIALWKQDPYFANVNWDITHPNNNPESLFIRSELLRSLKPHAILLSFLGKPQYSTDGIRMLHDLIEKLNPSRPEHLLASVTSLVSLQQEPGESGVKFMWRLRGLYSRLKSISIDKLFTILAIVGLDPDHYSGIISRYRAADPLITEASIFDLSEEVESEDARRPLTTPDDSLHITARRAGGTGDTNPDTTNSPPNSNSYPPSSGQRWKTIKSSFSQDKYCPTCFNRFDVEFHLTVGCPALASAGRIIEQDEAKAKAIIDKFNEYKNNKKQESQTGPSPADDQEEETSPAARRSTVTFLPSSAPQTKSSASAASASANPQGGQLKSPPEQSLKGGPSDDAADAKTVATSNPRNNHTVYDEYDELSSDSDDDIAFRTLMQWG